MGTNYKGINFMSVGKSQPNGPSQAPKRADYPTKAFNASAYRKAVVGHFKLKLPKKKQK